MTVTSCERQRALARRRKRNGGTIQASHPMVHANKVSSKDRDKVAKDDMICG